MKTMKELRDDVFTMYSVQLKRGEEDAFRGYLKNMTDDELEDALDGDDDFFHEFLYAKGLK